MNSSSGVWLFTYLKRIGPIDFVIAVMYVLMLSTIGLLMLRASAPTSGAGAIERRAANAPITWCIACR